LELDFTAFDNELTESARLQVVRAMFGKKYTDADSVRSDFETAVWKQVLLIPINTASTVEEMLEALDENGVHLGLDMTDYLALSDSQKDSVAAILIEERPGSGYDNCEAVKEVFELAVAKVKENGITDMQALFNAQFKEEQESVADENQDTEQSNEK